MAFTTSVALEYLRRAHEQDRLAHAYLIAGAAGSGKREVAAELTSLVTGLKTGQVFNAGTADVHVAEPESKSRRIVVDQIRSLEHALQMRSPTGRRKVAIIIDADRLQAQAANAFLKTLEEPPHNSLLLLLSAIPEALPDTVISRCITLNLAAGPVVVASAEERMLVELLRDNTRGTAGGVEAAYKMAQGFQRLLATIRQTIQEENNAALKRDEARYRNTTDGAWLEGREEYYKALNESMYLQRRAGLVDTIFAWWSDVLRANAGVERETHPKSSDEARDLARRLSTTDILRRLRWIEELRDHLGRNIQEALALEVAFLRVFGR